MKLGNKIIDFIQSMLSHNNEIKLEINSRESSKISEHMEGKKHTSK